MAARLQRALECPVPTAGDDVFAPALHDIADRFRQLGTPVQFQRFVAAHRGWLTGVAWQIANQARGRLPDLDDYVTMRLHSAGGEPTLAMLEIANRQEIPAAEMDSPAVRALTEMAILVMSLDNDRHSLIRELERGHNAEQNIYTVLTTPSMPPGASATASSHDSWTCATGCCPGSANPPAAMPADCRTASAATPSGACACRATSAGA
jgi:hypothetical protein